MKRSQLTRDNNKSYRKQDKIDLIHLLCRSDCARHSELLSPYHHSDNWHAIKKDEDSDKIVRNVM